MNALNETQIAEIVERVADRTVRATLLTLGIDVNNPLDTQRDMAVMRDVGRIAMDSEFRKDLESARVWRLALAKDDGVTADLASARRVRKILEASSSKGVITVVGAAFTGAVSLIVIGVQTVLGKH